MDNKTVKLLKAAKTINDLAEILGYQAKSLAYIIYKYPSENRYTTFEIDKKSGGKRVIDAPNKLLKELQSRLANKLQLCYQEIYGMHQYKKPFSYGFKRSEKINNNGEKKYYIFSAFNNAKNHRNKKYVFNFDLKDFFGTINYGRVRGFFIKNDKFLLEPKVATILAQIICHKNQLPQGAPTSPIMSCFIGHIFDIRMLKYTKKARCSYTRYADDITISTKLKNFPSIIAIKDEEKNLWSISHEVRGIVERSGFLINDSKTRMATTKDRQSVTGLVVNKSINISKDYYRQARAMCYTLFKTGDYYFRDKKNKNGANNEKGSLAQLRGIINYIYTIENSKKNLEKEVKKPEYSDGNEKRAGKSKLVSDFYYYDNFHASPKPLLVFEGKTDAIYFKYALKKLHIPYPSLIQCHGGKYSFNIKFIRHSLLFKTIFDATGTPALKKLIKNYRNKIGLFHNKNTKPVIVVVDNDSDGVTVWNAAKGISKNHSGIQSDELYFRVTDNLYIVKLNESKKKKMEDLFDQEMIQREEIHGKSWDFTNNNHEGKANGKIIFATKVVAKKYKEIDFSNFRPIINAIASIVENHKHTV
jgi:RNA-directed DNA polymerase